jgi:ADP-ribose pyrophosphatase YjhB (NUDIX family)
MKREYPEFPIVGVGAVIFKDNRVLLVKRAKEPGKGLWSLPGGALELGESLVDGLKREISEEVSIEIEVGGLIRVLDRILRDQEERVRYHYVIVDYWGWMVSGQPQAGSDVSDAQFVAVAELRDMGVHSAVEETVHMALRMRQRLQKEGTGAAFSS